jgi:hypothetical protein
MTPELEQLMTARHKAYQEWGAKGTENSTQKFLEANRAYVLARDNEQRQISSAVNPKAA